MFTDEMLRSAATESNAAFVNSVERDYDPDARLPLSKSFEKKIRKLYRKANHPFFYRTVHRVASVVFAVLITGSAWLAVDIDARAAFISWAREVYEDSIVYSFFNPRECGSVHHYELTGLPAGYEEVSAFEGETMGNRVYMKDTDVIVFAYQKATTETHNTILSAEYSHEIVKIKNNMGDFYSPKDLSQTNELFWVDESESILFQISSHLNREVLIELATSISRK